MTTPHMSPTAELMASRLRERDGRELVAVIPQMAAEGKSWREIAFYLRDVTSMRVSHETVRTWGLEWARTADGAAA